MSGQSAPRMPAVFVGHGSPMNAVQTNRYTQMWRSLGASLPKPRAILAISAHWYIRGIAVTAQSQPRTIHDFFGFPPELFAIRYPAAGDPSLAQRVRDMLAPQSVTMDESWGIDHGTWSVLVHMYPDASIPVLQLSIDASQPNRFHYELGAKLSALRDQGVLLLGSGNVVHNLRTIVWQPGAPPYDWAVEYNDRARAALLARDHEALIDYSRSGQAAQLSVPTPEHYLPLLYIIGAQRTDEDVQIVGDGIDLGSISMMSVRVG